MTCKRNRIKRVLFFFFFCLVFADSRRVAHPRCTGNAGRISRGCDRRARHSTSTTFTTRQPQQMYLCSVNRLSFFQSTLRRTTEKWKRRWKSSNPSRDRLEINGLGQRWSPSLFLPPPPPPPLLSSPPPSFLLPLLLPPLLLSVSFLCSLFFDYLKSNLEIPLRTARFTFKIVQRPFVVASGSIGSSRPERFVRNTSGRGSSFILRGSMNRIDFTFSLVVPGNANRRALRRINYSNETVARLAWPRSVYANEIVARLT